MAKRSDKLENRIFRNMEKCSKKCPFFNYGECKLYYETLTMGRGEDFYENGEYALRCKECISNVVPDSNAEIIKLLREINAKLR